MTMEVEVEGAPPMTSFSLRKGGKKSGVWIDVDHSCRDQMRSKLQILVPGTTSTCISAHGRVLSGHVNELLVNTVLTLVTTPNPANLDSAAWREKGRV